MPERLFMRGVADVTLTGEPEFIFSFSGACEHELNMRLIPATIIAVLIVYDM
jgi:hypothetical protein